MGTDLWQVRRNDARASACHFATRIARSESHDPTDSEGNVARRNFGLGCRSQSQTLGIVVALLDHLVDLAHPMFQGYDGTPAELKALFRAKVNQQYGKEEFPVVTLEEVDKAPTLHNQPPPQTKHATPEPAGL